MMISANVPRIPEVCILHSYSLIFWEYAVLRRIVPPDSDSAMDGADLNFTTELKLKLYYLTLQIGI